MTNLESSHVMFVEACNAARVNPDVSNLRDSGIATCRKCQFCYAASEFHVSLMVTSLCKDRTSLDHTMPLSCGAMHVKIMNFIDDEVCTSAIEFFSKKKIPTLQCARLENIGLCNAQTRHNI